MRSYTLYLPKKLNLLGAIKFSKRLRSLALYSEIKLNFSDVDRAFPFGSLLVSSCINQFIEDRENVKFLYEGVEVYNNQAHGYLGHIGFFENTGINVGREPGEAYGSQNYIPLSIITRQEIDNEARESGDHYGDIFIRKSDQMAHIIAHGFYPDEDEVDDKYIYKFASYSIREILRNCFEHSESDEICVFAQHLPSIGVVEVAVLDEGIGIFNSLRETHDPSDGNHALNLALSPGVSSKIDVSSDNKWGNSGFGLFTTSNLCTYFDRGSFCIVSDGHAKSLYGKTKCHDYNGLNFRGTAIMLKFSLEEDYYFENILEGIIQAGEKGLEKSGNKISASKMSQIVR